MGETHGRPSSLRPALTGDPAERETAVCQLMAFGDLQDDTARAWGPYLGELRAEAEAREDGRHPTGLKCLGCGKLGGTLRYILDKATVFALRVSRYEYAYGDTKGRRCGVLHERCARRWQRALGDEGWRRITEEDGG